MIEAVKCPLCGGQMVSRLNVRDNTRFHGCKNYPICKGTRNTDGEAPGERMRDRRARHDDLSPSERARQNDHRRWRS